MPKIKGTGGGIAKIDINMTPMIDVVFQLLTFFLMTFKVASAEGDFSLKLPNRGHDAGPQNVQIEVIVVRLAARANGDLASLAIGGNRPLAGPAAFEALHRYVDDMVSRARAAGRDEPEIEIDADDGLRYKNIIQVVAAVSGRVDDSGNVVPLVRKIKFTPKN